MVHGFFRASGIVMSIVFITPAGTGRPSVQNAWVISGEQRWVIFASAEGSSRLRNASLMRSDKVWVCCKVSVMYDSLVHVCLTCKRSHTSGGSGG